MSLPLVIIIDAEIGAGKSTLLKILEKNIDDIVCIEEPVDKWKEEGVLNDFYSNIKQNSYKFQTYTFITRIQKCIDAIKNVTYNTKVIVCERSIFSDRYIFVEMLHNSGLMSDIEFNMYGQWWDMWKTIMPFTPHVFVRLTTDLPNCIQRIKKRNRSEEIGVDVDYLTSLKNQHDVFHQQISKKYPVETIDGNVDYTTELGEKIIVDQFKKIIDKYHL